VTLIARRRPDPRGVQMWDDAGAGSGARASGRNRWSAASHLTVRPWPVHDGQLPVESWPTWGANGALFGPPELRRCRGQVAALAITPTAWRSSKTDRRFAKGARGMVRPNRGFSSRPTRLACGSCRAAVENRRGKIQVRSACDLVSLACQGAGTARRRSGLSTKWNG